MYILSSKHDNDILLTSYPVGSRLLKDVPWGHPKCPNVRDLQKTFMELLGDQQKIDDLMKMVIRCNNPCFTHVSLPFTGNTNI